MIVTFRPLKVRPPSWKAAGANRPYSPFSSTYSATETLLAKELHHLGAVNAFVQLDLADQARGVRLDGQLRAGAIANHPGVILTIETRAHGTLVYPCDAYSGRGGRPAWQENLRAIALGLEALRKVERYGIAGRGQQYAGFAELGSGMPMGSGEGMTLDRAAELLAAEACRGFGDDWVTAEALIGDRDLVAGAYRDAARLHHPDTGGDADMFRLITAARDLLLAGAP